MEKAEFQKVLFDGQVKSFKELVNQSCRDIAMCCRATHDVVGDRMDCKEYVASCAQKWFDDIDGLSDTEFRFMVMKDIVKHLMGRMIDDESGESDTGISEN